MCCIIINYFSDYIFPFILFNHSNLNFPSEMYFCSLELISSEFFKFLLLLLLLLLLFPRNILQLNIKRKNQIIFSFSPLLSLSLSHTHTHTHFHESRKINRYLNSYLCMHILCVNIYIYIYIYIYIFILRQVWNLPGWKITVCS